MKCPACQADNDDSTGTCARCGASLPGTPTEIIVAVDLKPGTLFHARYEILGPIGRGGMGMVYKARDRSLDEVVAIKVLRPDFSQDARMAERFKSEIKLARKVRHRNVCAIHDFGEERGLLYISMELVDGIDLKRLVRERGPLPPAEAYELAIQVAEGLQAVHDNGIIHRDLKTPNIMRDQQGVARLMDFGIAKLVGSEATMTGTGNIVGTPEYMSPEQGQGQKLDGRSDLYSLGIVIYELFTGRVPFKGDTPISTILKHLNEPLPLDLPPERLPPALRPVLRRVLAKDATARHATARDLAEALRRARSPSSRQQPVPTEMLEAPTLPRPIRAPRLPAWLLVIPVAAAAGLLTLALLRRPAESPIPPSLVEGSRPPAAALPAPLASAQAAPVPAVAVTEPPPSAPVARATPETRPAEARRLPTPPATGRSATPRAVLSLMPPPASAPPGSAPSSAPAASAPPPSAPAVEGVGWLQVVVRPWGEVSVDGKVVGTTPLDRFSLKPGPHSVSARHPAYERVTLQVTVRPDETQRVVFDFPKDGVRKE